MTDKLEVVARAIAKERWNTALHCLHGTNESALAHSERFAKAILSALEAEGLVIVPREPTPAMQKAIYICSMVPPGMTVEHARHIWRAMLAALEVKE